MGTRHQASGEGAPRVTAGARRSQPPWASKELDPTLHGVPAHPVALMFSGHERPVAILSINKHPSGDAKPLWHRVRSDSGQNVRDDL